jgi:hypothetical protein
MRFEEGYIPKLTQYAKRDIETPHHDTYPRMVHDVGPIEEPQIVVE